MAITHQITLGDISISEVDADPTVSGVSSPIGSLAIFNGGDGLFQKVGTNDTNWTDISRLANLNDVTLTSLSSGNIIYYNGTKFVNAVPGSTSGVQAYNANLTTIAGLSQGTNNVIISNGTVWGSAKLTLNNISNVIIGTAAQGETLRYNGTNFVNSDLYLGDLANASVAAPTTNSFLEYDGSQWISSSLRSGAIVGADGASYPNMYVDPDSNRSNKKLSVDSICLQFGKATVANGDWMPVAGISNAAAGYIPPYPGTIVAITGMTTNAAGNVRNYSIYVNSVEFGSQLSLGTDSAVEKSATNSNVNIDFDAGQKIRVQARNTSGTTTQANVIICLWIRWRI